jgi:NTE family protein
MREVAVAFYAKRRDVLARLWKARPVAFTDLLRGRSLTPQFDPALILESLVPGYELLPNTFEELKLPLKLIACDFYAWTECVLETGPLKPAIAASIAIPAVFRPVNIEGRYLIDGGACNPLPFDHVSSCSVTVACDVAGGPAGTADRSPGLIECVVGAAQISMQSVIREKLRWHQPDILVRPEINGVFILDFLKTQAILDMNVAFKDDLKRRLEHAIMTPFELPPLSAPAAEEGAQKRRRGLLADSGINLWRMVAGGRGKEADAVLDRPALGVAGAVIEPAKAGE